MARQTQTSRSRSVSSEFAFMTYVEVDGKGGLLLWARNERFIPDRLRATFSRGRWLTDTTLWFPDRERNLATTTVEGWWLEASVACQDLAPLSLGVIRRYSHAIGVWVLASKWVIEAVARQQVVPSLRTTDASDHWRAQWRVTPVRPDDRVRLSGLVSAMPGVARCFATEGSTQVSTASATLFNFMDAAADGLMRASSQAAAPLPLEGPNWVKRMADALSGPEDGFVVEGLVDKHLRKNIDRWIAPATTLGEGGRPMVGFRLSEPKSARGRWQLSYFLYTSDGGKVPASALNKANSAKHQALVDSMTAPREALLEALGRCARVFEPIGRSLEGDLPVRANITAAEAWDFLTRAAMQLERAGYFVEVPAALSKVGRRRVRARMRVGSPGMGDSSDGRQSSGLLSGLVNFKWEACLGTDTLTEDEFRLLAESKAPLVFHRGQWVAVDPGDVARLEALMGKGQGQLEAAEALRLALAGEVALPQSGGLSGAVICDGNVQGALDSLRDGTRGSESEDLALPKSLNAELRPYQSRGFSWLHSVTSTGFGACLADDMGLGKTIQLLTLLTWLAEDAEARGQDAPMFLIVCPTSVIGNWRREINRFVPNIGVVIHHGASRSTTYDNLLQRIDTRVGEGPVAVLTSFALARRDEELLNMNQWDCLVLDEAQNIKNPEAAQSKAVRRLPASRRIALTGTPVENRLTELWSIMDFLNPGLLGGRQSFKETFAVPIERYADEEAAELLKRVTAPFLLRRLKTDPNIAPELPDKIETVRYCPLTREQAALYQSTVDNAMEEIASLDTGVKRRGRILAMLTAIKQICNHPAHYHKDGNLASARSGKMVRFLTLLDECLNSDGQSLVFTQYREMGIILQQTISARFNVEVPFLHGGLSRKQRDAQVASFQQRTGPPVMIISLRAGGTGLNLTRANNVFHYDRWWNPAVEDQATDRAFRIGQTRDVTVHRMVSQGTMEEQIDQLLDNKRALMGRVVGTGETWLSDLDDAALRSLTALGQDAVFED